jgi:hypothetical protein
MGLAWTADEAGHPVLPGEDGPAIPGAAADPGVPWAAGHRHRRPTLLARGGQAVAHRITRLAGSDLAARQRHEVLAAHPPRRRTMAARKYWT